MIHPAHKNTTKNNSWRFASQNLLFKMKDATSCSSAEFMSSSCGNIPLSKAIVATTGAPCSPSSQYEKMSNKLTSTIKPLDDEKPLETMEMLI